MVRVEVQYFRGCPNSDEMIRRVKEAIKDLDGVEYNEVLIETEELARKYGFRGSPTLLINGEDFEGMPIPPVASLSCRVYIKGLPTIAQIKEKISSLLEKK